MIHDDWMLRVYDWLGTEIKVLKSRSNEEVENMPGGQKWEYITKELMRLRKYFYRGIHILQLDSVTRRCQW